MIFGQNGFNRQQPNSQSSKSGVAANIDDEAVDVRMEGGIASKRQRPMTGKVNSLDSRNQFSHVNL